jgi:NTE family protein
VRKRGGGKSAAAIGTLTCRGFAPSGRESSMLQSITGGQTPATDKYERWRKNREAKTLHNSKLAEADSRTALVLGGGAPNMALMAGALAAFAEREVTFDVVSTSGAGALAGLLWLAPKDLPPIERLKSVVDMNVSDLIYGVFPVNYKVFNKPGALADLWRASLSLFPWSAWLAPHPQRSSLDGLFVDWVDLMLASLCPTDLTPFSWGLCAPEPFIESIVDFAKIKHIAPYFYLNAYNLTKEIIDDFPKEEITPAHFRAALAFPFIYGPYRLGQDLYYEGAVRDCLNFKDLVEKHTGLKTIVVFDVLGSDALIRAPRNLYDSWVLSMIIPLVKTAEDNLELFKLKYNQGKANILKVKFDVPAADLPEVLDWSRSNGRRLFDIGYEAGLRFCDEHGEELKPARGKGPHLPRRAAHGISQPRRREKRRR